MAEGVQDAETGRIEAFSDGVFAIAITLLVLDLKLPELPHQASSDDLVYALLELSPRFFSLHSGAKPPKYGSR